MLPSMLLDLSTTDLAVSRVLAGLILAGLILSGIAEEGVCVSTSCLSWRGDDACLEALLAAGLLSSWWLTTVTLFMLRKTETGQEELGQKDGSHNQENDSYNAGGVESKISGG